MRQACRLATAVAALTLVVPLADAASSPWAGKWRTSFGPLTLTQTGAKVKGSYTCCGGGTVRGIAAGKTLTGTWSQPNKAHGDFVFVLVANGKGFVGKWRYTGKAWEKSPWSGVR